MEPEPVAELVEGLAEDSRRSGVETGRAGSRGQAPRRILEFAGQLLQPYVGIPKGTEEKAQEPGELDHLADAGEEVAWLDRRVRGESLSLGDELAGSDEQVGHCTAGGLDISQRSARGGMTAEGKAPPSDRSRGAEDNNQKQRRDADDPSAGHRRTPAGGWGGGAAIRGGACGPSARRGGRPPRCRRRRRRSRRGRSRRVNS